MVFKSTSVFLGGGAAEMRQNSGAHPAGFVNYLCVCMTVHPGGFEPPRHQFGHRMSLNLEPLIWMPSPSLVPQEDIIDVQHLGRMTLGEPALEAEVLALFSAQSADLVTRLQAIPADAAALVHTLKGSARAIGAFRVADAALVVEGAMKGNGDVVGAIVLLRRAVEEARAAIGRLSHRS